MKAIVDWAASRARMVLAFIVISLIAGVVSYGLLPKEDQPEIDIPVIFVSVELPGISAEDSERLLIQPMETELSDLNGLTDMNAIASEGYAGIALEFEFGWDKAQTVADVRDRMDKAESILPQGAQKYSINEIVFADFWVMLVNTGAVPERTLLRLGKEIQDRLERLEPVMEAALVGHRNEMLEVVIDPLLLEAYNVTGGELINVVTNNNQLIAAGEVESDQGAFSVKIPATYEDYRDVYELPVKVEGDSVVKLGQLADIRLNFEDRKGTARHNGVDAVALYVFNRRGFNLIETAQLVRDEIEAVRQTWPAELQQAVEVRMSNQGFVIASMINQLESSVLTAVALVMIVVLATLGTRAALLIGFAVPTSFLLCFVFLAAMGVAISGIVLFGLILAVGMLVDGAIVVVEYADRRISEGSGPMHAYVDAAKRMFWPVVSSTATTLCAFLPMLFWPGVSGEFMGMLPVTLIFVLSASLIVALIYLPVMGGVAGRLDRRIDETSRALRQAVPFWVIRAALVVVSVYVVFLGAMQLLNPGYLTGARLGGSGAPLAYLPGVVLFLAGAALTAVTVGSVRITPTRNRIRVGRRRTLFGGFIRFIVGNPIMPIVTICVVVGMIVATFNHYTQNNLGIEFFIDTEPEQATVYVRARGNLSLAEKDALVREVEEIILATPGIDSAFASAGDNEMSRNAQNTVPPGDAIGQVQIELIRWEDRPRVAGDPLLFGFFETANIAEEYDGNRILNDLESRLAEIPGIRAEIQKAESGPPVGKPVHLRLRSNDFDALRTAVEITLEKFSETEGLIDIDDSLPLPGIDWQIDVDVEKAGLFGTNVATVGAMVRLVTHGILLDTMRVDSSDEEIEIRVRLPDDYRLLATLDNLKVKTGDGHVPLSNLITRRPVQKLDEIERSNQERYFDVRANVTPGLRKIVDVASGETVGFAYPSDIEVDDGNDTYRSDLGLREITSGLAEQTLRLVPVNGAERVAILTEWLETGPFPYGVRAEWSGNREDEVESQTFLMNAFAGALGLMFVILLAQFNSFYNSVLVLLAVVMSTTGVLIGMLVMQQPFSTVMTGTGIVALAGIVVNNNIVLIDTYQEYRRYMPGVEAIIRTAEVRIRPVLMTTITTMAGLTPMMFGVSLDFINGGYTIDSPTALWWKQLATAVVFGLGTATALTLLYTPSMLALRVWIVTYANALARLLAWLSMPRGSRAARDWALKQTTRRMETPEIVWETGSAEERQSIAAATGDADGGPGGAPTPLRAAE